MATLWSLASTRMAQLSRVPRQRGRLTKGGLLRAGLRLSVVAAERASLRPNQWLNQEEVGGWSRSGRCCASRPLGPAWLCRSLPSRSSGAYSAGSMPWTQFQFKTHPPMLGHRRLCPVSADETDSSKRGVLIRTSQGCAAAFALI